MRQAGWPVVSAAEIGWLDTAQMVEVDRVMVEDLRIELVQMMENAGRNLARLVVDMYAPTSVGVYVGSGGNGGGGLVAARHLSNMGVRVHVVATRRASELAPAIQQQMAIVQRLGLPVGTASVDVDVSIDALIGYSLSGAPRGLALSFIEAFAQSPTPVVSLDVPSGLDASTGEAPGVVVHADATLTLAMPKVGLRDCEAVGRLFVGDISVPPAVYAGLDINVPAPPFERGPIIEIT